MNETTLTILNQLGGRMFLMMTGAKVLTYTENSLLFKLPKMSKVTYFEVFYDAGPDTYTVKAFNMRKEVRKEVLNESDVYCDQLVKMFENTTGLYTKLF